MRWSFRIKKENTVLTKCIKLNGKRNLIHSCVKKSKSNEAKVWENFFLLKADFLLRGKRRVDSTFSIFKEQENVSTTQAERREKIIERGQDKENEWKIWL